MYLWRDKFELTLQVCCAIGSLCQILQAELWTTPVY